ncbi:3-keto-5-aminohexanoate cleavage protein [Actinoplanes sp. NEAU-A12]|uniref:3-keto-5-aminohexanoate cleavage protein n=1 Tax=Actinoplanes sandaracinus TaxID=3045177 RepID=A0ABT6WYA2_9ACTN|nr:3-keto-5-aminohexanoate cleavage protein [Actinoplanes sandaracinus]MDI6104585.1 3-keto-5-aminohexanoate cleavage protein [Actinoplanes sandaracinus]
MTPQELAAAARTAVAAGAQDIHLHPKNRDGEDTLDPGAVAAALTAVRAVAPGIPVGVTTGAWTTPDPAKRASQIRSWTVLPDHASVNWHEDGAATVARTLLDRGIGIEAGIYSGTRAAQRFLSWPESHRVLRILAEVTETSPQAAIHAATELLEELRSATKSSILLHGEDDAAWAILQMAASLHLDMRIGLEDVLQLPDGTTAETNADLIHAALGIVQ